MQFVSDYMKAIDFTVFSCARRYRSHLILSSGVHLAFGCSNRRSHLGCKPGVWSLLTDLPSVTV